MLQRAFRLLVKTDGFPLVVIRQSYRNVSKIRGSAKSWVLYIQVGSIYKKEPRVGWTLACDLCADQLRAWPGVTSAGPSCRWPCSGPHPHLQPAGKGIQRAGEPLG